MQLTCPHCGFSRSIATGQIPPQVTRVNCPVCRERFALAEALQPEPDATLPAEAAAVATDTTEATEATETSGAADTHAPAPPNEPAPVAGDAPPALEPAGIGARYAALLLDALLILGMVGLLRGSLDRLAGGLRLEGQIVLGLAFALFALCLGFAYHALFIGACGQTPGKRLLRIRVITTDGAALTWGRAALREVFGKTLSLPLLLGYAMALFNPRHLAAHDKIADTRVVKDPC